MLVRKPNRIMLVLAACLFTMAILAGCGGSGQGAGNTSTATSASATQAQATTAQATTAATVATTTAAPETTASAVEQTKDKSSIAIANDGPLGRYPETITVTMVKDNNAGDWKWEHLSKVGETIEDNRFTRGILDSLNIKVEYLWISDPSQYNQKVKLAISTGEIPDFLKIPDGIRTDLMQLAEAGMIMPVDDILTEYSTPLTYQYITEDGGLAMAAVSYEGKVYGVPQVTAGIHVTPHLWMRTDWMNRLNLKPPETIDDYYDYMKTVSEADLNGDGSKVYGMMVAGKADGLGFFNQLEGLFVCFDAYPVQWVKDSAGNLVWGATLPEMKDAYKFVNRLYTEGLLDPEFPVKDYDKASEIVASGHAATVFGWHWYTHMCLTKNRENDPEADWEVFTSPTATGNPVRKRLELGLRSAFAVNKNAKNPEAIVKMLNLYYEWNFGPNSDYEYYSSPTIDGTLVNDIWGFGPIDTLHPQIDTANIEAIQPAFSGEMDPSTLTGAAKTFYENCVAEWTWMHMFGPGNTPGLQMVKAFHDPENLLKYNYFVGAPTPTMVDKWSQLLTLTNTTATQMITGEIDIDTGFDSFINDWNQMGGEQITKEVNEWYKANG